MEVNPKVWALLSIVCIISFAIVLYALIIVNQEQALIGCFTAALVLMGVEFAGMYDKKKEAK